MKFNNRVESSLTRLIFSIALFFMVMLPVFIYLESKYNRFPLYILLGLAIVAYTIVLLKNGFAIQYNDEEGFVEIRFYFVHPFFKKYKMVKIPIQHLENFRIEPSFFGLRLNLILTQKIEDGESVDFDPISISILNKQNLKTLKKSLSKLLIMNKLIEQKKAETSILKNNEQ